MKACAISIDAPNFYYMLNYCEDTPVNAGSAL